MQFFEGNGSTTNPGPLESSFSICAKPSSDIWDSAPDTHRFNAPILYRSMPLDTFHRAQVTVSANLSSDYEQCGLLLVIHHEDGSKKWIKSGIEFTHGLTTVGTVGKDRWPDWNIGPVSSPGEKVTIELVRDTLGLAVYLVKLAEEKQLQRELTWVFDGTGAEHCWVGAYAAKPGTEGPDLTAHFQDLIIE
jgi:regulation of enolase protein 1 (concanavalin A-like superfamily)